MTVRYWKTLLQKALFLEVPFLELLVMQKGIREIDSQGRIKHHDKPSQM
jgi:hypothetical protein